MLRHGKQKSKAYSAFVVESKLNHCSSIPTVVWTKLYFRTGRELYDSRYDFETELYSMRYAVIPVGQSVHFVVA